MYVQFWKQNDMILTLATSTPLSNLPLPLWSKSWVSRRRTAFELYNGSESNLHFWVGERIAHKYDLSECTDLAWIFQKLEN